MMSNSSYEPSDIVLEKEEYSYGFIIEVLTRGLYPDKQHVLREYIQNSYDAILAWRRLKKDPNYGEITISFSHPSILIYDNGTGMNWEKINQYRYVGYSEKKTGEGVGFRGIGKLSGISVADKLIVTTSPAGVKERYCLVFDADEMLSHILSLKLKGQNIPLNDLISTHTKLTKEPEEADLHYTVVELYNIKLDSKSLMDDKQLRKYLGMTAPVPFDPDFPYRSTVDAWLRKFVPDYDTVSLKLNNINIYKPFLEEINPPQMGFLLDEDETEEEIDQLGEPIAFYWYCEHAGKGQFDDPERRGLFYRIKNFTIGTNQLPRITLWNASPERAFYFWGEIHICDPNVIPSSDRENFEQNEARENLYKQGLQISRALNITAGGSSSKRRAREVIELAETTVEQVQTEAEDGLILKETKFNKMYTVRNAIEHVEKRLKDAPDDKFKKRGEKIIEAGKELLGKLEREESDVKSPSVVFDIKKALKLGEEALGIYDIIIQCVQEELSNQPDVFERIVKKIHTRLGDRLKK